MSTLPLSQYDLTGAPEPMHSLTHVVISPQNIAMEARLNRAKPLGRLQIWQMKKELTRLERQIQKLGDNQEAEIQEFIALRESLRVLLDYKFDLAQKRQTAPDDPHLKIQWEQLYETALPMERDYKALRNHLKHLQDMQRRAAAILQSIEDNPAVIAHSKAEVEKTRLQKEEARIHGQLLIDRATQQGFCYHWTDNKGNKRIQEIEFSEVHITMDAIFYKIAASYKTMFGAWKTKLPYGVKVYDLVKEDTLLEFSNACQRQVTAKASLTGGAWIVVHRLDTNDGLLNQVRYAEVMKRYPAKYRALIPLCVGVGHHRQVQWLNLADFPHMLVAGFTGSGKSNLVNNFICTLISMHTPEEVRIVLVDLKDGLEFSSYEHIPHLHGKVVDNIPALADTLQELEAVMSDRNHLMRGKAKRLTEYNIKYPDKKLPRIICIIDEVASIIAHGENTKRINNSLQQLTAKGRAPGVHIILSTQRPSVDAISGSIKVNLAARIVGRMPSHIDSQTVLGTGEAKDLAAVPGRMILQIGPDPISVQTPMIDEADIEAALKTAMEYETPAPLPVPEDTNVTQEWTPEKIVELSLNHLGGKISHKVVWEEIKDEGGLSRSQVRSILEHIWAMDCIVFNGKEYRVERGMGHIKKLVEISKESELPTSQ